MSPSVSASTGTLHFAVLIALMLAIQHRTDGALITSVNLDRKLGQVLVELHTGKKGRLCFLREENTATAVCSMIWGRYRKSQVIDLPAGDPLSDAVAALNGCDKFNPDNIGGWDLNNDCTVATGSSLLASSCATQRKGIDCYLADLLGPNGYEGLVLTILSGSVTTLCTKNVGIREAEAVCRTLGHSTNHALPLINRYKPSGNFTSLELVNCTFGGRLDACRWNSTPSQACKSPSNQLSVSCYPTPPTLKPWPSPTLNCFRQQANICFASNSLTSSSDLALIDAGNITNCNRSLEVVTKPNQQCLVIRDYENCARSINVTDLYTEYLLVVKFSGEKDDLGNLIRPPLNFLLYCEINKESLATGATILPQFTTPGPLRNSSLGGISVVQFFGEFTNGTLQKPLAKSQIIVGANIYAAVLLQEASLNTVLVLRDCFVTDGTVHSYLVWDRCNSSTNVLLIPVNDTLIIVNFKAFLLAGSSGSSAMSMQCRTIVCHKDDPSAECSRLCGSTFQKSNNVIEVGRNLPPEYQVTPPISFTVLPRDDTNSGARLSKSQGLWLLAMSLAWFQAYC